jgi:serine/threonine-protein kinase
MSDSAERVVGRYAVFAPLASGGMATVHLGRLLGSVGFSRTVAIKRLHQQLVHDRSFVTMFLDEAKLVARIKHPSVVPTLDVVAEGGELFIVMEYVQGETLSRLLRVAHERGAEVPARIASAIMSAVLQGLHAAHEARSEHGEALGIVHRDVSPQNVIVGADGVARVLDFGIARAFAREAPRKEAGLVGKLAYMPPEQIDGLPLDRRTDVYAAAVVLWETLACKRLFRADDNASLLELILQSPIDPPSKYNASVSKELDAVVLKGLSRDAKARFATAHDMALALEEATPPETNARVADWVRDLAGPALVQRAAMVEDVESASAPVSLQPERILAQLGEGGALAEEAKASDDQPTVVETPRAEEPELTTTKSARWVAIAVGALAGAVVAIVFLVKGC